MGSQNLPSAAMTVAPCAATRYRNILLNCVRFPFCRAAEAATRATTVARIPETDDDRRQFWLIVIVVRCERLTDGDEWLLLEFTSRPFPGRLRLDGGRGSSGPYLGGCFGRVLSYHRGLLSDSEGSGC